MNKSFLISFSEFYSKYRINYNSEGQMFIEFVFQNQIFSLSLKEFGQIIRIPYEGECSFSDKWSLDDLPYSVPTGDPYQTNPPFPDDIKLLVQIERQDVVTRIRHEQEIIVEDNQILTREITDVMKTWVDIIRENYDHVMYPLAAQQERKTRKDYGTRRGRSSTSSLSAFGQPSSSHPNDDDNDGNDKRTLRETLLPPLVLRLFVDLSNEEDDTTTPSLITKSSFPSPPNAPSKTPSTKDTSSTFGTTSSSFESKPQSSPPSSNNTPLPQPFNPFLDDIMDVSLRPSNPIPLQSHPCLDITLSLSSITPIDHILDTPSPQPPPQLPLMGHPIYFNTFDYYEVNYLCCFHNRNLVFTLRDEINLMFAHLEYILTSAIA
ncbi:hypothetical protein Tco_1365111 [Tanacetum coccineum]